MPPPNSCGGDHFRHPHPVACRREASCFVFSRQRGATPPSQGWVCFGSPWCQISWANGPSSPAPRALADATGRLAVVRQACAALTVAAPAAGDQVAQVVAATQCQRHDVVGRAGPTAAVGAAITGRLEHGTAI